MTGISLNNDAETAHAPLLCSSSGQVGSGGVQSTDCCSPVWSRVVELGRSTGPPSLGDIQKQAQYL